PGFARVNGAKLLRTRPVAGFGKQLTRPNASRDLPNSAVSRQRRRVVRVVGQGLPCAPAIDLTSCGHADNSPERSPENPYAKHRWVMVQSARYTQQEGRSLVATRRRVWAWA